MSCLGTLNLLVSRNNLPPKYTSISASQNEIIKIIMISKQVLILKALWCHIPNLMLILTSGANSGNSMMSIIFVYNCLSGQLRSQHSKTNVGYLSSPLERHNGQPQRQMPSENQTDRSKPSKPTQSSEAARVAIQVVTLTHTTICKRTKVIRTGWGYNHISRAFKWHHKD